MLRKRFFESIGVDENNDALNLWRNAWAECFHLQSSWIQNFRGWKLRNRERERCSHRERDRQRGERNEPFFWQTYITRPDTNVYVYDYNETKSLKFRKPLGDIPLISIWFHPSPILHSFLLSIHPSVHALDLVCCHLSVAVQLDICLFSSRYTCRK